MVNVLTGRLLCACINATMVDESTPPDRNAPSGTSATICFATASRSNASKRSAASISVPAKGTLASTTAFMFQNATGAGKAPGLTAAVATVRNVPGGSLKIPR